VPDARDADDRCVGQLRRCGLRPGEGRQRIEAARDEERRDAARDRLVHGGGRGGDLPSLAAVFVEIRPAADTLVLYRRGIVRKRFPTGRDEILRRRERIAFATADAKGEAVAESRDIRTRRWCPTGSIQSNRLDGIGTAGSEPIDPIRRGLERRHGVVLVAQPVDQRSAVEDNLDIFAGCRVADGCRQRLGFELVDQSGEGFFEMRMGGVAGWFRRAGLEEVVEAGARVPPVCGDVLGRGQD
jgi:hypothetical protein